MVGIRTLPPKMRPTKRLSAPLIVFFITQICVGVLWLQTRSQVLACPKKHSASNNDQRSYNKNNSTSIALPKEVLRLPDIKPRAFEPWPKANAFPCLEPDLMWYRVVVQRSPAHEGLLYVKEMKTGSSTLAGVNLRIAKAAAERLEKPYKLCKMRFDHTAAWRLEYGQRRRGQSYLWTVLREPTKRAVSQFFHFMVSRDKLEPSDKNFREYLESFLFTNYYLRDLSVVPPHEWQTDRDWQTNLLKAARDILGQYDFIGITERLDESLVALQMLLDLPTSDILHLSAKGKGGFDDGGYNFTCSYIVRTACVCVCVRALLCCVWMLQGIDSCAHCFMCVTTKNAGTSLCVAFNARVFPIRYMEKPSGGG